MNLDTLKRLVGSIKKWRDIAHGRKVDHGDNNCPLCCKFWGMDKCDGCPVQERTDRPSCEGTPYHEWHSHHSYSDNHSLYLGLRVECPRCRELALEEVWFLCTLLPEDEE